MNRDILSKIEQEQMISREELEELLTTTDQKLILNPGKVIEFNK